METSKAEGYAGAKPKIIPGTKPTPHIQSIPPEEAVIQETKSQTTRRQEQVHEHHAALLRDEVCNTIHGMVNVDQGAV